MLGGEKGSVAFHGDHRPASIYVDGQAISEPVESTQEGTMLTFDKTYNDRAEVSVFGESVQRLLPIEYQETEYLQGDGNAYIDTGYAFTDVALRIESKFHKIGASVVNPFGVDIGLTADGTAYGGRQMHGHCYSNSLYLGKSSVSSFTGDGSNIDIVLEFEHDGANARWVVNGQERTYEGTNEWTGTATTDYLFATHSQTLTSNEATYTMTGRIYYHRMYDSAGRIVRDFIPCRRLSDGECGMYDRCTQQFFGNIGRGAFSCGPDVDTTAEKVPTPSTPMPIESRASACVETSNSDGSKTSTTDLTALLDGRELRSLPDGTRDELQVRDNGDGTGDVVLVERVGKLGLYFQDYNRWIRNDNSTTEKGLFHIIKTTAENYGDSSPEIIESNAFFGSKTWDNVQNTSIGEMKNAPAVFVFCVDQSKINGTTAKDMNDYMGSLGYEPYLYYKLATPTETVLGTIPMPETFYYTTHVWEANGSDISARVKVFV